MSDADAPAITPQALRRKQLIVAGVLGGVVLVGVIAAVVLSFTFSQKSDNPTSPDDVARQWVRAVLEHDTGRQDDLECSGNDTSVAVRRVGASPSAVVAATEAIPHGTDRWTVPVSVGGRTVEVGVKEQSGTYLVC